MEILTGKRWNKTLEKDGTSVCLLLRYVMLAICSLFFVSNSESNTLRLLIPPDMMDFKWCLHKVFVVKKQSCEPIIDTDETKNDYLQVLTILK